MKFAKGHGTENDFVILLDPDGATGLTADLAVRLCDRRAGIGADGVLRAVRTAALGSLGVSAGRAAAGGADAVRAGADAAWAGADAARAAADGAPAGRPGAGGTRRGEDARPEWFMDYRNADGSLAEMCGNGIRVFATYLVRHGLADGPELTVGTRAGPRRVRMAPDGDVTAEMGSVSVLGPGQAVVGGRTCRGLRVSVGNPHLACLVDTPLAEFDLSRPPRLDRGMFPGGANLELVLVTGVSSVAMRVHERGSGETRSCGTGAVAAAAAAATAAGPDGGRWEVTTPGGELAVTLDSGRAWLTGPAVIVAEGELDPAWLAASGRRRGRGIGAARTAAGPRS
jgi:diaminopimelate epimerase